MKAQILVVSAVHDDNVFLWLAHFELGSPAERQGDKKLVYRLIQLFSSTEIFSKRRKIYA